MALLFSDGFDNYDSAQLSAEWNSFTNANIATTGQRTGRGCLSLGGSGNASVTFGAKSTVIAGAAVKALYGNRDFLTLRDAATSQLRVFLNDGSYTLSLLRGNTVIATSTRSIVLNQYFYVEVKATIANVGGTAEVRVNGQTWISYSGDTQDTGNPSADNLQVANSNGYYDDLYICDDQGADCNTFLGDVKIQSFVPTADGTYKEWTPSAGTDHFSLVDEIPPNGDTDYIAAGAVGLRDTYKLTPSVAGTVLAVHLKFYIRKDDAGTRFVAPLIRSAGADYEGTAQAVNGTFLCMRQAYSAHPAGRAWTAADLSNDEFGAKVTA